MQTIKKIALVICSVISFSVANAATFSDSLQFELLLNRNMLREIKINGDFINRLEITSNRFILLSTDKQLYILGINGLKPLGKTSEFIKSFALTPDSLLMIVRNKEVCTFDSIGNLTHLYKIPSENMGISSGKAGMYLYDRDNQKQIKSLYFILPKGKYTKLFSVTSPIECVLENKNSILLSSGNTLFSFMPKTKKMEALATLPKGQTIKSVTSDPLSNRIYFSTDDLIFSLKDTVVSLITDKMGGTVRYFNKGLIVFDPKQQLLVRILGLERTIASQASQKKNAVQENEVKTTPQENQVKPVPQENQVVKTLTNQSVIDLKKSGLSDDLIITLINRNQVDFNLSVDSVIELSDNNISPDLIKAMRQAMKKQTQGGTQNR